MTATRGIVYFVGIGLVLVALWMFFVQTNLNRWVPVGLAVAAVVLIVGVSVMSFAETSPQTNLPRREGDVNIVERNVETRRPPL
ncbi:MAG: hypothetical protein ACYDBQ_12325 [Thermoplasmatota archaeon]